MKRSMASPMSRISVTRRSPPADGGILRIVVPQSSPELDRGRAPHPVLGQSSFCPVPGTKRARGRSRRVPARLRNSNGYAGAGARPTRRRLRTSRCHSPTPRKRERRGATRPPPGSMQPCGGQRARSARKNVVTSAASSSGASRAAKCPPRGISVHRWMLKTCSANKRGGCRISRGKDA